MADQMFMGSPLADTLVLRSPSSANDIEKTLLLKTTFIHRDMQPIVGNYLGLLAAIEECPHMILILANRAILADIAAKKSLVSDSRNKFLKAQQRVPASPHPIHSVCC